jgi:cytochrome b pre-mRNA-processing protein 3
MLKLLRNSERKKQLAAALQDQLVARARAPFFYAALGVADSMDGRFDLVTLHAWLVLERLKAVRQDDIAQALTDMLFVGFDEALREQGIGDMGLGRRMRAMAEAFYGRLKVYSSARDGTELALALARNIWRGQGGEEPARRLALYVENARAALAACDLAAGRLDFGPLPADISRHG